MNEQQGYLTAIEQDPEFDAFIESVTPHEEIQQVWMAEFFLILKILWELFQLMKGLGWFDKWLKVRKVRRAMKLPMPKEGEAGTNFRMLALQKIKDDLVVQVSSPI